jgi:hypothetical protein
MPLQIVVGIGNLVNCRRIMIDATNVAEQGHTKQHYFILQDPDLDSYKSFFLASETNNQQLQYRLIKKIIDMKGFLPRRYNTE